MNRGKLIVSVFVLSMLVLGSAAMAGHEIVGAAKCKMCHMAKTGDQYKIWSETAHSQAFATLASDKSKQIADGLGLGDPQKAEACLACHTTNAFLGKDVVVNAKGKYTDDEGVGCEACHGAGSDYRKTKVMKNREAAVANGLIIALDQAYCEKCHNEESPTFEGFEFEKQWELIKHPIPATE